MNRWRRWWLNRDTWGALLAGWFICPILGHRHGRKMHGVICMRCRKFWPTGW